MAAWASTRVHQGRFTVRDSDTEHCTHVVYAFMAINETTSEIQSVNPLIDLDVGGKGRGKQFYIFILVISKFILKCIY